MKSENHYQHHETSTKIKIQKIIEFCERMNISYYKNDVFKTFNVLKRQSYEMLRSDSLILFHDVDTTILVTILV